MSEVAVIDQADVQKLAALLGANDRPQGGSDRLPVLKVNTRRKDDNKRKIEQGTFFLKGVDGEAVYTEKVRIRVLSQQFQWMHYDPDQKKLVNKTLLIPNFFTEARDMQGGLRCGKPTSKVFKELTALEKKKYKDIKCFRQLRVLVSYTGTDADGNGHVVENVPALVMLKGSNFSPFEDEFVKAIPKGADFWDYWCDVTAEEIENDATTYYVMHFAPDLSTRLPLDKATYDTMLHFLEMINKENEYIDRRHNEALREGQLDGDAIDAVAEVIEDADLAADFLDEAPF